MYIDTICTLLLLCDTLYYEHTWRKPYMYDISNFIGGNYLRSLSCAPSPHHNKLQNMWVYVKGGWTWTVCLGNASCFSGLPAHKNVTKYACCPNEYDHVLFTLHIRRRTIYYLVNLIAPCVLLASMTLLEFLLPNECGEKLTLGICSVIRSHFHFSFSNTYIVLTVHTVLV